MEKCSISLEKDVYDRWCSLQKSMGLGSSTQTASILLERFENLQPGKLPTVPCVRCHKPLSLFCTWCNLPPLLQSLDEGQNSVGRAAVSHADNTQVTSRASSQCVPSPVQQEIGVVDGGTGRQEGNGQGDSHDSEKEVAKAFKRQQSVASASQGHHPLVNRTRESQYKSVSVETELDSSSDQNIGQQTSSDNDVSLRSGSRVPRDEHSATALTFMCQKCLLTFNSEVTLKKHKCKRKKKSPMCGKEPIACTVCSDSFKTHILFGEHMKSHGVTHPFICDKCDKAFVTRKKLTAHHCPKRPKTPHVPSKTRSQRPSHEVHVCDKCGKSFTQKNLLQRHCLRMHTSAEARPYICTECGFGFLAKNELERHINRHKGEKTFICETCSAAFVDQSSLTRHMKRHAADREMCICEVCGGFFSDRHNLNTHKLIHSGERPFKCSFCDATFRQSSILRKHERKHKGERKHVCSECGRGFTEREYWRSHMRTHTGERPFVCDVCGAGFAQKGSLNSHRKTHKIMHLDTVDEIK